jgi:hypothetical protein
MLLLSNELTANLESIAPILKLVTSITTTV